MCVRESVCVSVCVCVREREREREKERECVCVRESECECECACVRVYVRACMQAMGRSRAKEIRDQGAGYRQILRDGWAHYTLASSLPIWYEAGNPH